MNDNFLENSTQDPMEYSRRIEELYPDVYRKMTPYIDRAVGQITSVEELTGDELNMLSHQVVSESGILHEMPRGYNENAIIDMARILLLTAIYQRYYDDPSYYPYQGDAYPYTYPYPYPYYFEPTPPLFLPFWGGFFGRRRGHGRGPGFGRGHGHGFGHRR